MVYNLGLRDLRIESAYDSETDDVLNELYLPALSQSSMYRRLTGFFSSTSLAIAARGMAQLVANGGKMQLVAGARLSKKDVNAIIEGTEEAEKIISDNIIEDIDKIENELIKDHVKALSWMVANGKLEIKIAIPLDDKGKPIDNEMVQQSGMFHMKVGIFEDSDGDYVSFSGSINESASGWTKNVEELKMFRSWGTEHEVNQLRSDWEKFERYWYGKSKRVKIIDVPSAVESKMIEIAPKSFQELNTSLVKNRRIKLRDYQKTCVDSWFENDYKGIFEMATGTGKTFAAIGCLKKILKERGEMAIVIACPYTHLINQWKRELKKFGLNVSVEALGNYNSWNNKLMNDILDLNNGHIDNFIVLTTHKTFSTKKFIEIIKNIGSEVLIIADEVHWLGSEKRRRGLIENYNYRIGLSATPTRWLDDMGTEILLEYFGGTVFQFPLEKAIKEGYLTPYKYYPHFVELTSEELYKYKDLTKKIAIQYQKSKESDEKRKLLELLLIQRQRIIKNADQKYEKLIEILDSVGDIHHCLVYCSPKQIMKVQSILNKLFITQHKFTAKESRKERDTILESFAAKKYKALVAMKCLDEGVDVPCTKTAIILASSGNPKEYIQRRGRILRKNPGKDFAVIHDIVVVPTIDGKISSEYLDIEKKILEKELSRMKEFSKSSNNPTYTLNSLYPIQKKYKLKI